MSLCAESRLQVNPVNLSFAFLLQAIMQKAGEMLQDAIPLHVDKLQIESSLEMLQTAFVTALKLDEVSAAQIIELSQKASGEMGMVDVHLLPIVAVRCEVRFARTVQLFYCSSLES